MYIILYTFRSAAKEHVNAYCPCSPQPEGGLLREPVFLCRFLSGGPMMEAREEKQHMSACPFSSCRLIGGGVRVCMGWGGMMFLCISRRICISARPSLFVGGMHMHMEINLRFGQTYLCLMSQCVCTRLCASARLSLAYDVDWVESISCRAFSCVGVMIL